MTTQTDNKTTQTDNKIRTRLRRAAKVTAVAAVPVIGLTSLGIGMTAPAGAQGATRPAAHHHTAKPGEVRPAASTRFTVYNLSPYQMRLTSYEGKNEGHPPIGSTIDIGGQQSFEVQYWFMETTHNRFTYQLLDGDRVVGDIGGTAWLGPLSDPGIHMGYTKGRYVDNVVSQNNREISVFGKAGSVMTVPADRKAEVGKLLNAFCAGQHGATCDFTPTSTEKRMTDWEKSGIPEYNDTSSPITKKFTVEHTVLAKENYEVSASMKATVAKVFEASISAKYGRETSRSEKFTKETTLTIKPGMKLTPLGRYPIVRDTGDFTIRVGSSTWKVTGVIVDTPDAKQFADIKWSESPIDSAADLQGAQNILDAPPVIDTGTS